jgi:hypothetical protein
MSVVAYADSTILRVPDTGPTLAVGVRTAVDEKGD